MKLNDETGRALAYGLIFTSFVGLYSYLISLRYKDAGDLQQQKSASEQFADHQANYQFCNNLMKETAGDSGLERFVLDKVKIPAGVDNGRSCREVLAGYSTE